MTALAAAFGADHNDLVSVTNGFSAALLGAATIAALGALTAATWLRTPTPAATTHSDHEAVST